MNNRKSKKITDHLKKTSVKRFSVFVIVAFVFLVISKLSNDYKQSLKLKISLSNLDDEIVLVNDSLNTLDAIVKAKGFSLLKFMIDNTKTIYVDAQNDVTQNNQSFVLSVQKNRYLIEDQLGSSVELLSIKPDTLNIFYSKNASRFVPIVLSSNVSFAAGYDIIEDYTFDIDSVKIVGVEEDVYGIDFLNTVPLNLNNVNESINENIELVKPKNIEIFPKMIKVSAEVSRFTEGTLEVPITIVNKPRNLTINYFPKNVTLSYYVNLQDFNNVKASDFEVQCDYSSLKDDLDFFKPKVTKKPKFVKRVSLKQKRIDFIKL